MSSTVDFLGELRDLGIQLHPGDGGRLRIKAKKGVVTDEIRGRIQEEKQAILELLSMARFVKARESGQIPRRKPNRPVPLSIAQERLWFLDRLNPGTPLYNLPVAFRLLGPLSVACLTNALREILLRHEAIRTVFEPGKALPIQSVRAVPDRFLDVVDLGGLETGSGEPCFRRNFMQEIQRPFDLERGPLFRFFLFRIAPREHIAVFCFHHIIGDGSSMGILSRELSTIYGALVSGSNPRMPPANLQYADFSVWQRGHMTEAFLKRQLAYWKRVLAGYSEIPELPTDYPRPRVPTHAGGEFTSKIAVPDAFFDLCQQRNVTVFMATLAVFAILLVRHSGSERVHIGTPIDNRNRKELESIFGFFVNTLVLRLDLDENASFGGLLDRVRRITLEAFENRDLPFERLVEQMAVPKDLGRTPLFQTMFATGNFDSREDMRRELAPGLGLEPVVFQSGSAKFDLSLDIFQAGRTFIATFTYSLDLFSRNRIVGLAEHYRLLLERLTASPETPLWRIRMFGDGERQLSLCEWNDTGLPRPPSGTVLALLQRSVEWGPERPAVICGDQAVDYAALHAGASRVTRRLRENGVGRGDIVCIRIDRRPELIQGMLGIMMAGAAYLPLDGGIPQQRLLRMVETSQPRALLTRRDFQGGSEIAAAVPDLPVVNVEEPTGMAEIPLEALPDPLDLAYVIFTSGSTGRPKGVAVTHRGLLNHNLAVIDIYGLRPEDKVLQFGSISFDLAIEQIFPTLLAGAAIVLPAHELALGSEELIAHIASQRITVAIMATAYWHELTESLHRTKSTLPPGLRILPVGGEKAEAGTLEKWRNLASPPVTWVNTYGPVEATIIVSSYTVGPHHQRLSGSIPIGRPLPNCRLYVLDPRGEIQAAGIPGELAIGGICLARGYLARPSLTAKRFIPDPYGSGDMPGSRLYRSGDLARFLPSGCLEFLGRIDFQVKIRGFRVETAEIEQVMTRFPGVERAMVLAVPHPGGGLQLAGFAVSAQEPDLAALRVWLADRLPDYMVPTQLVRIADLPLTPTGKVDREALANIERDSPSKDLFVPPREGTESVLAAMWANLLGGKRIAADDHFFRLGGHSLLATRVISRIRETFAVDLPLRVMFQRPVLSELAAAIDGARGGEAGPPEPPLESRGGTGFPPLSFAQERLWFLDRLIPGDNAYNVSFIQRFSGTFDLDAFFFAWKAVVARHEILRTRFQDTEEGPVQVVGDATDLPAEILDLTLLDRETSRAEGENLARISAASPFDIQRGPLFRVRLIRLGLKEHLFVLSMHHIICDGWSVGVLARELAALYEARIFEKPANLRELAVQYADYAVWQRAWLRGDVLARQLSYWTAKLDSLSVLDLPSDRPRNALRSGQAAYWVFEVDRATQAALGEIALQTETTFFMLLLAAFKSLLARYSGQDDIAVGATIANRNRRQIEPLIGFFVNTLVLRTDLADDPGFTELLLRVRQTCLDAFSHGDVPFEKLVEELKPERALNHSPLFQVVFDLAVETDAGFGMPGLEIAALDDAGQNAKFDLGLTMQERSDGLGGVVEYDTALYDEATMARMTGHFRNLLVSVAANPHTPLSGLNLLSPNERRRTLRDWNDTDRDYPLKTPVHRHFEDRAAATPAATAVVAGDDYLTYSALNIRANRLARFLLARGFQAETPVAIRLDPGTRVFVAFLAVLKAGGYYVPLDSATPPHRLRAIVEDANLGWELTTQALRIGDSNPNPSVLLDADESAIAQGPGSNPGISSSPHHLAYAIYTSGSTGRPKGVAVAHRSLANLCFAIIDFYGIDGSDKSALVSGIAVDASVIPIYPILLAGATSVVCAHRHGIGTAEWHALLERQRITFVSVNTAFWHQWVHDLDEGGRNLPKSLRVVDVGGEKANAALYQKWAQFAGDRIRWADTYGPTEITVVATGYLQEPGARVFAGRTIGRPLPNYRAYILDNRLGLVPVGVTGMLYIAGPGLARGYLNRPDPTAGAFIPNPFSRKCGERLYHTGDLCRYDPDGKIAILGRRDFQVKIRGFRVELGEIDAVFADHPLVSEALTLAHRKSEEETELVCYIIPRKLPAGDGEAWGLASRLRLDVQKSLPDYLIPKSIAFVQAYPLTRTGKVDAESLSRTDPVRPEPRVTGKRFLSPMEELLAPIWAETLGIASVDSGCDFFEAGGHSLLAIKLLGRIEKRCGIDLPVVTLFQNPTLSKFAGFAEKVSTGGLPFVIPLRAGGERAPWFLIHPVGGQIHWYLGLARALAPQHPVFGIQSPGLSQSTPPLDDLKCLATNYIEAVEPLQNRAPFRLAGWSMGGTIALEMARQLTAAGRSVEKLVLIDTHNFEKADPGEDDEKAAALAWANDLTGGEIRDWGALHGRLAGLPDGEQRASVMSWLAKKHELSEGLSSGRIERLFEVYMANHRALLGYRGHPYEGPVTLIRARGSDADAKGSALDDGALGWREICKSLTVLDLDGDHYSLLAAGADDLAAIMDNPWQQPGQTV